MAIASPDVAHWGMAGWRTLLTRGTFHAVGVAVLSLAAHSGSIATDRSGQTVTTGVVEGQVLYAGTAPAPIAVQNTTDPEMCGRVHILQDLLIAPETQGIANVIVAVDNVPRGRRPDVAPGRLALDNRQCQFVPHAAVLTSGSVIEVTNSDPAFHTAHFYGALEANLALPLEGMTVRRHVDRPGLIMVKCDVHGWMQAFIRVDDHPFHAVTDEAGSFRMAGVPAGAYELDIWHARLGRQRQSVTVEPGVTTRLTVTY